MSSGEFGGPSVNVSGDTSVSSAGELLRRARLSAGVHIESIAFSLKVPVGKIEALERDDLDDLPDAVFARALASSVCRTLKMDPAPVLALLPQTAVQFLPANDAGVYAVFRDGSERSASRSALARVSRPLGLLVIILLLGAGVLAWMPSSWLRLDFSNALNSQPVAVANTLPSPVGTDVASKSQEAAAATPKVTASVAPVEPATSAMKPISTTLASESDHLVAANTPRLMMTARGETWVQVKDAQGAILLERILRAGETASVNQPGRLSVVVGRADATEVTVTGEKFDIASLARENVARFEIKP